MAPLKLSEVKYLLRIVTPIRFHDLRHTAASLMLNHGVPVIVVSRLGHSTATITMDIYGHLIPGFQREASNLIGSLISPINVTQELKPKSMNIDNLFFLFIHASRRVPANRYLGLMA